MATDEKRGFIYCLFCGTPQIEYHHSQLRSQGGSDSFENLVPLCPACHERRHQETLKVTRVGDVVTFTDTSTGEVIERQMTPQVATGPSELVDQARAVQTWMDLLIFGGRLKTETDEHLATLYDEMRTIKHKTWMVQAAVVAEVQSRASYGEDAIGDVAKAIGCEPRSAWRRGQIYREILSKPECATACENLRGETWFQEALSADDPVAAINYAEERKAGDPSYTCAKFRAELRGREESTLQKIVLVCGHKNKADQEIAETLERRYKVSVTIQESTAEMGDRPPISISTRLPIPTAIGYSDFRERVAF